MSITLESTKFMMKLALPFYLLWESSSFTVATQSILNECFLLSSDQRTWICPLNGEVTDDNERSTNRTRAIHTEKHHNIHPALHQVKHRTQEKATLGIAQHVTENLVNKSPALMKKQSQWWERGVEQITAFIDRSRLPEQGGKRLLESSGSRLTEHGAEKVAERGAERLIKRGIETSSEKGAERILERGVERLAEKNYGKLIERGVEGTFERGAERLAEHGAKRLTERGTERLLKIGTERLAEGGVERLVEKGTDKFLTIGSQRFVEGNIGRMAESGTKKVAERNGERLAARVLERSGESSLGRLEERSIQRLLPKLGRSFSLALPALGALFGWYLFQQDVKRMSQEREKKTKYLFGVAALTDLVDVLLHVWIVYALWSHLSHSSMIVAEKMSLACAIGSTISAVLGEILCSLPQNQTTDSRPALP